MNKPIQHESYIPFTYPADEVETVVRDDNIHKLMDFICYYLLVDKNPRVKMAAICFAAGYDVGRIFNCDNTQRSISKALNVNWRQFSLAVKNVGEEFNLRCVNTDKPTGMEKVYRNTNKI